MVNIILLVALWNTVCSILRLKRGRPQTSFYCGLIGYSGYNDFSKDKVNMLLYWNSMERGKDSTGLYTPMTGIIKDAKEAKEFIEEKREEIVEDVLLIGHVRAKTVGAVNKENAHPFQYGDIRLAHNGTLTNHWELCRQAGLNSADYQVDSQVLTAILAKDKHPKVLTKFLGAAALLFTDVEEDNRLYAFRNGGRPLFRGKVDDNMYISSISESLLAIGCTGVEEFKEDYLYVIHEGKILKTVKMRRPEVKKKEPAGTYSYPSLNHYMGYDCDDDAIEDDRMKSNQVHVPHSGQRVTNKDIVGRWAMCDQNITYYGRNKVDIAVGDWVYINDYSLLNTWDIQVMVESGETKEISMHSLRLSSMRFEKDDFVVAMQDLFLVKAPKDKIAVCGEIFQVHEVNKDSLGVTTVKDRKIKLNYDTVRRATKGEIDNHIATQIAAQKTEESKKQVAILKEEVKYQTVNGKTVVDMLCEFDNLLDDIRHAHNKLPQDVPVKINALEKKLQEAMDEVIVIEASES